MSLGDYLTDICHMWMISKNIGIWTYEANGFSNK